LPISTGKLRQLATSLDNTTLAVACGDGFIRLFEPSFMNEIQSFGIHKDGATSVAFHPTKHVLMSGGKDARLRAYHLVNGDEVLNIPAHNYSIYSIAFSPDSALCATASRDKTIKLWN